MKYQRSILSSLMVITLFASLGTTMAQQLDVPIIEHADENLDTCAYGQVIGLKSEGDNFLAVRSGPASDYTKLDELKNDDKVWMYDVQGEWFGIVYDVEAAICGPLEKDREVETDGKKGWVHSKWIEGIAGQQ